MPNPCKLPALLAAVLALTACADQPPASSGIVISPKVPSLEANRAGAGDVGDSVKTLTAPKTHSLDTVRIGPGDVGDAVTTATAIWGVGMVEQNPLISPLGDAAPLALIPLKYGAKKVLVAIGQTLSVETGGALATCSNVAGIAGIAIIPALTIGAVCAIVYHQHTIRDYEEKTGRNIHGQLLQDTISPVVKEQ